MAGNSYKLEVKITAKDLLSPSMQNLIKNLEPVREKLNAVSEEAQNLGRKLKTVFSPLASIINGSLAKNVADYGVTVFEASKKIGISSKFLQEYSYAANTANISSDDFRSAMEKMNTDMGALRANTGPLVDDLNDIAPALNEQLKSAGSNEEAFELMLDAIRQTKDEAQKANLAQLLFGNDNMVSLANKSTEALKSLKDEANAKGLIIKDEDLKNAYTFNRSINSLKDSVKGFGQAIATKLWPIISPVVDKISQWIDKNREFIQQQIEKYIKQFADWIEKIDFDKVLAGITGFIEKTSKMIDSVGGLRNVLIGLTVFMSGQLIVSLANLILSVGQLGRALFTLSNVGLSLFAGSLKSMVVGMFNAGRIGAVLLANDLKSLGNLAVSTAKQQIPIFIDMLKSMGMAMLSMAKTAIVELTRSIIIFGRALLTTPLGWFIAAIALVSTIGALIYENWGPIKDFMKDLWDKIKEIVSKGFDYIKELVSNMDKWLLDISGINKILGLIDTVKDKLGGGDYDYNIMATASEANTPSPIVESAAISRSMAEVVVNLGNLPKGSTVETSKSGSGTDLLVEYGFSGSTRNT